MQSNKYIICNCKFDITTPEKMVDEAFFGEFRCDFQEADYFIEVIKADKMPEKTGKCAYSDGRKSRYVSSTIRDYVDEICGADGFKDFACLEDNSRLYIKYDGFLRELAVFEGIHLPQLLLRKGVGLLHCSFIEHEGQAILFAGHKQVGKSTQAGLWEKYASATVINGDRAGIFIKDGVVFAGGVPYCGTSKICINKQLPIKAIVCLSQGTENTLKRLSGFEAFTSLLGKFTYNTWDVDDVNRISDLLTTVVESVPVFSFSCVKDKSAVEFLKTNLERMA